MRAPRSLRRTGDRIRRNDGEALSDGLYEFYARVWQRTGWHVPRGTNIYGLDRNALLPDAFWVDLLEGVQRDCEFVGPVGTMRSVGSVAEEWMRRTFRPEYADEMADTTCVTVNVFSNGVWRYDREDEAGTLPPRPVTERPSTSPGRATTTD